MAEEDLKKGGVQFKAVYIGFTPIVHPVHDMTSDIRELLFGYTLDTLQSLQDNSPLPACNSVLKMLIETPKAQDVNVLMVISAKSITVTYDDERNRAKQGMLIMRYPMKYVSVIKWMGPKYFAFIAKKGDGSNRRCCMFNAVEQNTAHLIMTTLQQAIRICSEEVMREEREREEKERRERERERSDTSASEDTTPTVSQNSSSTSLVQQEVQFERRQRQAPLPIDKIIPGQKAAELAQYRWYHGILSRDEAGRVLKSPGEFLIRESENKRNGQVILSGRDNDGDLKNLLLIDDEGNVKTEDRDFTSVAELVNYYHINKTAVMMANSPQLYLKTPIDRPH